MALALVFASTPEFKATFPSCTRSNYEIGG